MTFTGTTHFLSVNEHQGVEQSCRDDLELLAYIGDQLPPENRYPEDPSDLSDDNFGDHPPFPPENDGDAPPSSPPSKNNNPQESVDHPSHTQGSMQLPQWQDPEQPAAL